MKKVFNVFYLVLLVLLSCKGDHLLQGRAGKNIGMQGIGNNSFNINGRLKVTGIQLSNELGRPVQLRGMSTHGLQYRGNCYNPASLELLANGWGADILRISMYIQEDGYETNPVYFTNFVDSLVNKCYDMGIYALIDWHMLHPGDPNANTALAKVFFEHVSKKHANKGNVLYEICNEPNNDNYAVTWPMIKNYAQQIIPIIRNNDPNSVIIVGTSEFASRPDLVIGQTLAYNNIMYTMHFYAGDSGQIDRMGYVSKAMQNGIPVFVTEFGTQNGYGDGANNFEMSSKWLQFLSERKISWCNWNYSDSPLSGAVWKTGTCPDGPWTDANLKESGFWIRERLSSPEDDWSGNFPSWDYQMGTGTGSGSQFNPSAQLKVSESKSGAPGFLPYPPTGVARAVLAPSAGTGMNLTNAVLKIGASNGAVPNQFSVYNIAGSSSLATISFKLSFNNSSQGTAVLAVGNSSASIFKNSAAYDNSKQTGLFAAIRFLVGNSNTNPEHRYFNGTEYLHQDYDADLFDKSGDLNVEIYCNNTTIDKTYSRNQGAGTYTMPANSMHIFVNNVRVKYNGNANLPATGELSSYSPIDALMLSGSGSTGNTLNFSVSNIKVRALTGN